MSDEKNGTPDDRDLQSADGYYTPWSPSKPWPSLTAVYLYWQSKQAAGAGASCPDCDDLIQISYKDMPENTAAFLTFEDYQKMSRLTPADYEELYKQAFTLPAQDNKDKSDE